MNQSEVSTGIDQIQSPVKLSAKQKIKELWNKFYSNKKIFWPIAGALGLLLLTLILGLSFGSRNSSVRKSVSTPNPAISQTPQATESADILTIINFKLNKLDTQIKEFDVSQSHLSPPSINFDIRF